MFLPWWPARGISIALLIKRVTDGYQVEPETDIRIIPCVGTFETSPDDKPPSREAAWATRALHLIAERPPDQTATAVFGEVWFSSRPLHQSSSGDQVQGRFPHRRSRAGAPQVVAGIATLPKSSGSCALRTCEGRNYSAHHMSRIEL